MGTKQNRLHNDKVVIKPPCRLSVISVAIKDGDCQASRKIGSVCSFEWLGTCRATAVKMNFPPSL